MIFTVVGAIASIHSAWFQKPVGPSLGPPQQQQSPQRTPVAPVTLLDARVDTNLQEHFLGSQLKLAPSLEKQEVDLAGKLATKDDWLASIATIDFKFRNTASLAAFLWKVELSVDSARLDDSPVMTFSCSSEDGRLDFYARNTGWGPAKCTGRLRNKTLQSIFSDSELMLDGVIGSSERQRVGSLAIRGFNARQRTMVNDLIKALRRTLDSGESGYAIGPVEFIGYCTASNDVTQEIVADVQPRARRTVTDQEILINEHGFAVGGTPVAYDMIPSEPTFVAILDPAKAPEKKEYSLSRRIPPGDVERFFITTVATRSALFRLRLRFFVNESTILETAPVEVALVSPTDYEPNIRDGDELVLDGMTWVLRRKNDAKGRILRPSQ
jgi:hypothetical protein